MEQDQYTEGFRHIGKGLRLLADAFDKVNTAPTQPRVEKANPVAEAQTTTARAKKDADKVAKEKKPSNEIEHDEPEVTNPDPEPEPEKTKAAPKEKKTSKKTEVDFEGLDRDKKIEHLRSRMVEVSVKVGGDRDKTYSFLKKYKAAKVHELSDENLDGLKNDIEVFLAGPDANDF